MALEVNDWIETAKKYSVGYSSWIFCTLTTPWKADPSVINGTSDKKDTVPGKFASDIFIIIAISIFIGATIGASIPNRPPLKDRTTVLIVVTGVWIFVGWLIHVVCRLLKGKGTFASSMLAIIQVLSAVYVVSNVAAFIIVTSTKLYFPKLAFLVGSDPGTILVSIQCLALLYYIPAALSAIHDFKKVALVFVAIFSAVCSLLIFLPIAVAGGC